MVELIGFYRSESMYDQRISADVVGMTPKVHSSQYVLVLISSFVMELEFHCCFSLLGLAKSSTYGCF